MFDVNEIDENELKYVINELIKKFPDIDSDIIKNRVSSGFRFGEGGFPIVSLEDWIDIFSNKKETDLKHIENEYYITFVNSGLVIIYNFKTGKEYAYGIIK